MFIQWKTRLKAIEQCKWIGNRSKPNVRARGDKLWGRLAMQILIFFFGSQVVSDVFATKSTAHLAHSGSLRRSSALNKVLARLNTSWPCCHSLSRPGKCQPQSGYNWNYKKADATVQLPLVEERGQLLGCRGADKACAFNSSPSYLIVQIRCS